ncbi:carbohydrate-binding protein [Paenibacillus sp. SYP-B3998]|uniref:Carbohydrate-binding protein n=1 Tax=Paenibacillus sp. SYP-B3998 TaxID=2678564 RepID=A0A6G3ZZJ5_9BACL|nr:basic secretory protein-like protein [Paenibacillus sp. SYP-B3998]NEW07633.1 carbohydrate-binding protein [Paenibacillus sp. SYP-B3998]
MKKLAMLIFAGAFVLGISCSVNVSTAAAAQSTTTTTPKNLAVGGTVTASGENAPNEGKDSAFDQTPYSKWLVFNSPGWLQYQFTMANVVTSYSITSANDYPDRDPIGWVLKGSNDGSIWTVLDTRQNESFTYRYQTKTYSFSNTTAYKFVKFDNLTNQAGSGILQLAEIKLFDGSVDTWTTIKPTVTASGENGPHEGKENLVDGTSVTKWLAPEATGWLQFDFGKQVTIDGYALTAANDVPERDPKSWVLQGSNDNANWTTIDTKSNESFSLRHQRNHYILKNNSAAYQFYRLNNLKNHSGNRLQLGEVEFSRTNDMWHVIHPVIEVQNLDSAGNGRLFDQALPNAADDILVIVRKVNEVLYNNPAELQGGVRKIRVTIEDVPGVAWASGDSVQKTVGFSSRFLRDIAADPNQSVRDEIIGVLYHELTHCYQYDDNRYADKNVGGLSYMVEGLADTVRFEVGYHNRYGMTKGGTWQDGYGTTGNFFRWIEDTKTKGFIRKLNASLTPFDGLDWNENKIQELTGIRVNQLWTQYQVTLPE